MAFLIAQEDTNGYRCSCCMSTYDRDPVWVQTEHGARVAWERFLADEGIESFEPYSLTITDGSDGTVIAEAQKHWGQTRQDRYSQTWFTGHWRGEKLPERQAA